LNVQIIDDVVKATVYIPEGRERFFIKRIDAYVSETTRSGKPKNQDLIGSIENIKLALVDSFWTDDLKALPSDTAINCEIWLRYEVKGTDSEPWNSIEGIFHDICDELGICVDKNKRILFPERIVKLITANREGLKALLIACEYIAEIRRAEEPASFFIRMGRQEQRQWNEDLRSRCVFNKSPTCRTVTKAETSSIADIARWQNGMISRSSYQLLTRHPLPTYSNQAFADSSP